MGKKKNTKKNWSFHIFSRDDSAAVFDCNSCASSRTKRSL